MARPTKLNKTIQNKIVKLIRTGVSIEDACSFSGIGERTFYDWMERGAEGENEFSQFSQSVNRARNAAKVTAIGTLRNAMEPYTETSTATETLTETRLTRQGEPYEYKRELTRKTVTVYAGDWRAAVEYLKRRYSDEWGDKQKIEDWRTQAIADIRAGKIPYEALVEAFDADLATQLFTAAGVPVQVGQGAQSVGAADADGG